MNKKISFSKIVSSAVFGNILEYYDFTLFAFLAPHISPLFFPAEDSLSAIMAGLGVYAVGYFMRPLGAIFFGYIGDVYGRKQALTLSVIMMGLPTMIIGCLPTYTSIGILSPLFLTLCRLFQGLCVGGEYSGAVIFTLENISERRQVVAGSLITASSALGGLCGSMVAMLVLLHPMPSWMWRCAFILGAIIAVVGLYIRLRIMENNPIVYVKRKAPFWEVVQKHPQTILYNIGITGFTGIMYNVSLTYLGIFLTTVKRWPLSLALSVVSLATGFYILMVPLFAKLADDIGVRRTLIMGAIATILVIYPVFSILTAATNFLTVLLGTMVLVLVTACFHGPLNFYMTTLFPSRCRYSGMAVSYSLGMAFLGGTTSLILTSLVQWAGDPMICVAYVEAGAFLGLFCVIRARPALEREGQILTSSQVVLPANDEASLSLRQNPAFVKEG